MEYINTMKKNQNYYMEFIHSLHSASDSFTQWVVLGHEPAFRKEHKKILQQKNREKI